MTTQTDLAVSGMTCAACAARVEKVLNRLPGVTASVNLATHSARVTHPPQVAAETLIATVEKAGYGAVVRQRGQPRALPVSERAEWLELGIAAALTLPFWVQMAFMWVSGAHGTQGDLPPWLQWLLATPVQLWSGRRYYRGAWRALRGGAANMDVLVALGTSMAYGWSMAVYLLGLPGHLYFETGATVITLVLLGKVLEARSRGLAAYAIEALARSQPATATLERGGVRVTVPVTEVRMDDVFVVLPGDAVAVDGEVLDGSSAVDEALLTGESLPAFKLQGSRVHAGTLNQQGTLRCRATGVGEHTALAAMIRLVEDAQASKAPIQRLADRVSGIFVPVVVALAALTWLGWALVAHDYAAATLNAVAVLVIACPCALGLATPVAMLVGSTLGARHGILIRNAAALEYAGRITVLALDKTGTLTEGKPAVIDVIVLDGSREQLLASAAALERDSRHPLARAIVSAAGQLTLYPVTSFEQHAGFGASGLIEGVRVEVGSPAYAAQLGYALPAADVEDLQRAGSTVMFAARGGRLLGLIAAADRLRPGTAAVLRELAAMGIRPVMLTGDNALTAEAVAREAGIAEWHAGMLPAAKADYLRALGARGAITGMAGDGINDAPALAVADASFAIGGGADAAIHSADITLARGDLQAVAAAIRLSRATLSKIRQNLFFAFFYNALGLPLAAAGWLTPVIAGAAMALSSVSVVANALTLRKLRI